MFIYSKSTCQLKKKIAFQVMEKSIWIRLRSPQCRLYTTISYIAIGISKPSAQFSFWYQKTFDFWETHLRFLSVCEPQGHSVIEVKKWYNNTSYNIIEIQTLVSSNVNITDQNKRWLSLLKSSQSGHCFNNQAFQTRVIKININ